MVSVTFSGLQTKILTDEGGRQDYCLKTRLFRLSSDLAESGKNANILSEEETIVIQF